MLQGSVGKFFEIILLRLCCPLIFTKKIQIFVVIHRFPQACFRVFVDRMDPLRLRCCCIFQCHGETRHLGNFAGWPFP